MGQTSPNIQTFASAQGAAYKVYSIIDKVRNSLYPHCMYITQLPLPHHLTMMLKDLQIWRRHMGSYRGTILVKGTVVLLALEKVSTSLSDWTGHSLIYSDRGAAPVFAEYLFFIMTIQISLEASVGCSIVQTSVYLSTNKCAHSFKQKCKSMKCPLRASQDFFPSK